MLAGYVSLVLSVLALQNFKAHCLPLQVSPRISGKRDDEHVGPGMWRESTMATVGFPDRPQRTWLPDTPALVPATPMLSNGAKSPCEGVKLPTPACVPL